MSRQDCGEGLNTAEGAALNRQESHSGPQFARTLPAVSEHSVIDGPLQAGETFGRYRIERILGSGGMAHVYKAWDEELNEAVALKLIRRELSSSPELTLRFK